MEQSQLLAHCGSSKITREELKVIPAPAGSATQCPSSSGTRISNPQPLVLSCFRAGLLGPITVKF